jgi:hypothetical protein
VNVLLPGAAGATEQDVDTATQVIAPVSRSLRLDVIHLGGFDNDSHRPRRTGAFRVETSKLHTNEPPETTHEPSLGERP